MARSDTILVGTFSQNNGGAQVPPNMIGNKIWYSESHGYFMMTNNSNTPISDFGFDRWEKFIDQNVISFSSPGVKAFIDRAYNQWKFGEPEPFGQSPDTNYFNPQAEYQTPVGVNNRRNSSVAEDGAMDEHKKEIKDPTRHISIFCALTLIIAIIAAIMIKFGQPILQAVSALLL